MRTIHVDGIEVQIGKMGKAHWMWDEEMKMHLPCCSKLRAGTSRKFPNMHTRCMHGPLIGDQILTGDCGEHEKER